MNIAKIMIPKSLTVFLHDGDSVRQGIESLGNHSFTALPVLDGNGVYIGSVTEGDFLRCLLAEGTADKKELENLRIRDILRRDFCPPLSIDEEQDQVIDSVLRQNFVPIVDARNVFCGIVTRRRLIAYLTGRELTLN